MATRMTSKGQVTIPKEVREYLGLKPGSAVSFEVGADGDVIVRPAIRPRAPSRFAAVLGSATIKMRTEEIMALTRGE